MRENETPTNNENLAEKTEKFPPLRYPGETDEQYDARCTQEAERERIAEESRDEAKRMTGPELRADSLEDNGGQNTGQYTGNALSDTEAPVHLLHGCSLVRLGQPAC